MIKQPDTFKYCANCREELEDRTSYKACPGCGKHYYFNAKPCVAILLTNTNNELLLVKRAHDPFKNWWDVPGGFVEPNETLEEAIRRELKEETSLDAENLQYIGSVHEEYEFRGEAVPIVAAIFSGTVPAGADVSVADDVSAYQFKAINEVQADQIAFDNQRSFIAGWLSKQ